MPLRSGKVLPKDGKSQSSAQGNNSRPQQLAHNAHGTTAIKRTRSHADTSPTDPAQQLPARKRRATKPRARSPAAAKQAQPKEVIDLTGDDDPDEENGHQPVPRSNTRSVRSSGRPHRAFKDVMEGPELEDDAHTSRRVRTQSAEQSFEGQEKMVNQMVARSKMTTRSRKWKVMHQQAGVPFKDHDSVQEENSSASWGVRNESVQDSGGRGNGCSGLAVVMFTQAEAVKILERVIQGAASNARPPYTLRTGEYISFPVTMSYHLGGMGRYGWAPSRIAADDPDQTAIKDCEFAPQKAPRNMPRNSNHEAFHDGQAPQRQAAHGMHTVAADYVFNWGTNYGKSIREVGRHYIASVLASPRLAQLLEEHIGLRKALKLYAHDDPRLSSAPSSPLAYAIPIRPAASALEALAPGILPDEPTVPKTLEELGLGPSEVARVRAAEKYVLDFGRFRGKSLEQVTPAYLQDLEHNHFGLETHAGLRAALFFFYERNPEKYRMDYGKHEGMTLQEVPKDYLLVLESGGSRFQKKEMLQQALWHYNEKMRRSNAKLSGTLGRSGSA
ncbi:hypothetical protein HBH98_085980 [Parastagonospora nodorum]|nr:hypothetical protein HBH52_100730 [Parastagonospora nodorum]KAH4066022.1 hypothetical protein HBH50_154040 [Parastagonospora nodorum]KAH4087721.1 hypothetical protein HBH48_136350 [Parastagonospora nodorum]KAH4103838.1 hypothetical protein HBH46_106030 [Parastagonospora nodorum]KAH4115987.1 hypothetical protein HBH47_174370 [Parastagonospora nodorum]